MTDYKSNNKRGIKMTTKYFTDNLTEEQINTLELIIERPLTDKEKYEFEFEVEGSIAPADPSVGVFDAYIEEIIISYNSKDCSEIFEQEISKGIFDSIVWDSIKDGY
jgi:hypothetical protein